MDWFSAAPGRALRWVPTTRPQPSPIGPSAPGVGRWANAAVAGRGRGPRL